MLKSGFSIISTQGIGSSLVSFQMIFEALQFESASDIRLLLTEVETSKNPGIQPIHDQRATAVIILCSIANISLVDFEPYGKQCNTE